MHKGLIEEGSTKTAETKWWELDLRSLAVLRLALGLFVLLTLASFLGDTANFFTDAGVLPRKVLAQSVLANSWLDFHFGSGSWHTQVLLNSMLAAFAVGLIAGWRTPWMTLGCWVLLGSLHARNPLIFDRGDLELSLVLFWSLFLPLGARWSLDCKAGRKPWGQATGMAPVALVVQFAFIYLFAAYFKYGDFWLLRGDALEHSLISPLFSSSISLALAKLSPSFLKLINYTVIVCQFLLSFLLLTPIMVPLTRKIAVSMVLTFHLSVALIFKLGLFPWLGACLPLALLTKEFWQTTGAKLQNWADLKLGSGQLEEEKPAYLASRECSIAFFLVLAMATNFLHAQGKFNNAIYNAADFIGISQHWDLFAPTPPFYRTFNIAVTTKEGNVITVFAGPPTREAPNLESFPSHRWRMLMVTTMYDELSFIRPGVVRVLAAIKGINIDDMAGAKFTSDFWAPDDKGQLNEPSEIVMWVKKP